MSAILQPNCSSTSGFILSGVPEYENLNFWLGFPLFVMYFVAVIGNASILYIIRVNSELHEPMYIFLFMLSVVEMFIATTTMPKMLGIFWFNQSAITFNVCLTQMFFVLFFSALESGVLVAMAVDRYVAICHPLRYSSILTNNNIFKMAALIVVRSFLMFPLPISIIRFTEWKKNLLTHSYCLHQEVMNAACGDIKFNYVYGLLFIIVVMGVDFLFISFSYFLIIKAVLGVVVEDSTKAFSTCAAHICVVLMYYIPLIGLSVVHRFKSNAVPNLHVLFGDVYLLFPPVINPLIYGIKTKQIRQGLIKLCSKIIYHHKSSTM